jgi:ribulose-5-phosphate 4-epimerase/fuculose-1-phosphate aldolase
MTEPTAIAIGDEAGAPYDEWEARVDLAAAHRLAVMDGINEGTWNHFSAVVPGSADEVLLTPPATHWSQVTAGSLSVVGPDRKRHRREGGMTWIGYSFHYPIHEARPDAACVLHAHPPHATAFATLEDPRVPMAEAGAIFELYGRIAYGDSWDGLDKGLDKGRRAAEALGDKKVLLMKHHGVIVLGSSIAQAYCDLYRLERSCRILLLALSSGRKLAEVGDETGGRFAGGLSGMHPYQRDYWRAMRRLLDETQPDYAT